MLTKVLPALIAEDELFGVGREAEARIFRLSTDGFDRKNGETGFLLSLLNELLRQAAALGITAVQSVRNDLGVLDAFTCLKSFVDLLPHNVPHFILVDEVQNFFLLIKSDGTLDGLSIDQMRRCMLVNCRFTFCIPLFSHLSALQDLQVAGRQQPHSLHVGGDWQQHGDVLGQSGARPGERVLDSQPSALGAPANSREGQRA